MSGDILPLVGGKFGTMGIRCAVEDLIGVRVLCRLIHLRAMQARVSRVWTTCVRCETIWANASYMRLVQDDMRPTLGDMCPRRGHRLMEVGIRPRW